MKRAGWSRFIYTRASEMAKRPKPNFEPGIKKKVGYRNPPREHQFKKGRSGNPGGKPKKKMPTDLLDAIKERLDTPLAPGGPTLLAIIINSEFKSAVNGNHRSAKFLLDCYDLASDRQRKTGSDKQADLEAAKRIFDLDPRFFSEPANQNDPEQGSDPSPDQADNGDDSDVSDGGEDGDDSNDD